jgi:hypothetical protein
MLWFCKHFKAISNTGVVLLVQGGSNMTGKNCDLFTHK